MLNKRISNYVGRLWLFPSKLDRLMSSWMPSILLTKLGLPRKIYRLLKSNPNTASNSKLQGYLEDW